MAVQIAEDTKAENTVVDIEDVTNVWGASSATTDSDKNKILQAKSTWTNHFHKLHAQLDIQDLLFTVNTKQGPRTLVDHVSLKLDSGDVLAMMGPSGAGKTTVLDLMTMKIPGNKASGSVKLNNELMTESVFRSHCALCEQYDTHWAFLSCKEIMNFTAELCITKTEERKERVEAIMEHLGLLECANAKAGNAFLKGMSGGQRKRLSLGMALLKGPTVLFLDEPTSGLDAASTKGCMEYVETFAKEAKMIVIATIHQPSTEVFMGFTKVLFLCNGRTAFFGAPQDVADYCNGQKVVEIVGHGLPELTNPADYFIQIVNSEFVGSEQVDKIVGLWGDRGDKGKVTEAADELENLLPKGHLHPGVCSQFFTLLRRHSLLAIRDPTLYVGRMVVFLLANSFFAIIYIKSRDRHNKYAVPRFFLSIWFGAATSMFAIVVVYAVNEEFAIVRKGIHNGIERTTAYILAKLCIQLPFMILLAIAALVVPAYAIADFNIDGILGYHAIMAIMLWCFEAMGEFLGNSFANPLIGMLNMVNLWFVAFLFSGVFLDPEFIIWPFRLFCYILPLRWGFRGMNYLETHGTTYGGAVPAPHLPQGFECPDGGPLACFGLTGDQVRKSLKSTFGLLDEDDTVAQDILFLTIIAVFFKVLSFVVVMARTLWVTPLKPSEGGS